MVNLAIKERDHKMSRFLDPTNDVAFKMIFGTENHKGLLISFLNSVLKLEKERRIKTVDFLPQEQVSLIKEAKTSILDIKCTDERNFQYIIEVQNKKVPSFVKRTQFYVAHSYVNQASKGSNYTDLSPVILLALANHTLFPNKGNVISYHKTLDTHTNEHDLKDMSYVFIELPKFNKESQECNSLVDEWLYFFKNWQYTRKIPLTFKEEEIKEAYRTIEECNWSKSEMEAYVKANIALTDEFDARQKEREEGKVEGLKEGLEKVAKSILLKNMDKKDISELTGLSTKEIEKLL